VPGYLSAVGSEADGITFFVGSLWFTSAAFLQYLEVVNVDRDPSGVDFRQRFRLLALEPRRIDWWSTLVQFVGTLFFQRYDVSRLECGPLSPSTQPSRLGPRRAWFCVLSRGEWARVV